jgi:hypothetical protein
MLLCNSGREVVAMPAAGMETRMSTMKIKAPPHMFHIYIQTTELKL